MRRSKEKGGGGVTQAETASFAEFARIAGFRRSYVTELKGAGRLVLTDDGREVRVAESLALIESTRDPAKAGVVARHAANREAGGVGAAPVARTAAQAPPGAADGGDEGEPDVAPDSHASRRSKALADKEEALARKALREEAIELGQLMAGDQVVATIAAGLTALRVRLENLAYDLAPQLAAIADEARVQSLLTDEIESALADLSRQLSALAKADPAEAGEG
jgi:hypothetical protein